MNLVIVYIFVVLSAAHSVYIKRKPFVRIIHLEEDNNDKADPGEPLFLTPLIKEGRISEAKQKSSVSHPDFKDVESYSGFLTVNEAYNSNLFFWFFPAKNNPDDAPVVLWLQGGPGSSSLFGLFTENGPFMFTEEDKLSLRDYSWHVHHSILFIDNPAGTGFSFTNSDGFCRNQTQIGKELYEGISQFFQLFPDLKKNDFFATGESYAGKYIPALAYTIHKNNPTADVKINLKGLAIGNGYSDPRHQNGYADYLYQTGLVDINQRNHMQIYEHVIDSFIDVGWYRRAAEHFDTFLQLYVNYSGSHNPYNYLTEEDPTEILEVYLTKYVTSSEVRKAIHVGSLTYHTPEDGVQDALFEDMAKSVAPWISELLSHYRVLIYNGQVDVIVAYPLTLNYLYNLDFEGADDYKVAQRKIWRVDKQLAGYVKTAGKLTELLVRDAGHMVPFDQPKLAFDLIYRFTRNLPYEK